MVRRVLAFFQQQEQAQAVRLLLPLEQAQALDCVRYGVANIEAAPLDMALSIGGDGTLLGVCRRVYKKGVPVCGINLGTVGFLVDIEIQELESKLQKILAHKYQIEERLMLTGSLLRGEEEKPLGVAINDIVITKGGLARMLSLRLDINQTRVADYKADGLIVSTPTGSTAYSLSAGGPIVNPLVKALLLTPICPHSFNIRPLVVCETDEVRMHIHMGDEPQEVLATLDGQRTCCLAAGDIVRVRRAHEAARIVKFADKDYYGTMRQKLWGTP